MNHQGDIQTKGGLSRRRQNGRRVAAARGDYLRSDFQLVDVLKRGGLPLHAKKLMANVALKHSLLSGDIEHVISVQK